MYDVWANKRRTELKERKASKVDAPVVVAQKVVKPTTTQAKAETKVTKTVTKAPTPAPAVVAKKV